MRIIIWSWNENRLFLTQQSFVKLQMKLLQKTEINIIIRPGGHYDGVMWLERAVIDVRQLQAPIYTQSVQRWLLLEQYRKVKGVRGSVEKEVKGGLLLVCHPQNMFKPFTNTSTHISVFLLLNDFYFTNASHFVLHHHTGSQIYLSPAAGAVLQ